MAVKQIEPSFSVSKGSEVPLNKTTAFVTHVLSVDIYVSMILLL